MWGKLERHNCGYRSVEWGRGFVVRGKARDVKWRSLCPVFRSNQLFFTFLYFYPSMHRIHLQHSIGTNCTLVKAKVKSYNSCSSIVELEGICVCMATSLDLKLIENDPTITSFCILYSSST